MSDARIRRRGDPITHAAQWHDRAGGRAWCGPYFTLCPSDARIVEDDVDCMGCLVRAACQDSKVFEIPIIGTGTDAFGDAVYYKQVFGPHTPYVTECCASESPCDWHEAKELP